MRRFVPLAILCTATIAACGSSHKSSTSSSSTTAATATPSSAGSATPAGMAGRFIVAGELSGFAPRGEPKFVTSVQTWAAETTPHKSEEGKVLARLNTLGFVAGGQQPLYGTNSGVEGVSVVEQLGSAKAARAEVAYAPGQPAPPGGTLTLFRVPGIPTAKGFELSGKEGSGSNVAFAKGRYYYVVGEASGEASARAPLIAAAQSLYRRVSG